MPTPSTPLLLRNCAVADCSNSYAGETAELSITIVDNTISWIGEDSKIPKSTVEYNEIDVENRLVTPGLIDCHTHLIYADNRAAEYATRLDGTSYEEIATAGGGILSTVKATRTASLSELYQQSSNRLIQWLASGFTTIEIKSGYGLDYESELKMLNVANQLKRNHAIDIHPTLLAAHTLPPEFKENGDGYIDWIISHLLPQVASQNLATAVDVFCESIGFSQQQSRKLLSAAKDLGFQLKIHADQLSNLQGSQMAAELSALSADHLEYLDQAGIDAMKKSSTVAVLLPLAFYFLKETQTPPIELLRTAQVDIAIASDSNPGSAPVNSPLLSMNMATTLFGLTPLEALKGITINAAKALGIENLVGSIEVNKRADIAIWDLERAAELSYWIGGSPLHRRIYRGELDLRT